MSATPPPPPITAAVLERRAATLEDTRAFMRARGYLEVDTPILRARASMEPHLVSFETAQVAPDGARRPLYMHTSPEYAMKIVLGACARSIFQLARVFRNEEGSDTHHHEFTMLEWYRVEADYRALIDETEALVRHLAMRHATSPGLLRWRDARNDARQPFERLSVAEAFARHAGVANVLTADAPALAAAARAAGCRVGDDWSWEDLFHLLLLERVEPQLGRDRPTFLLDYPPRLAALARVRPARDAAPAVAERFELYACGLELCNGFSELTDAAEQRRRFVAEQAQRRAMGLPAHALDEALLDALSRAPSCTGNALGLDRLLMLLLGAPRVQDVMVVC